MRLWFQSPIGWGLSCEVPGCGGRAPAGAVSIPYWLGSKLRAFGIVASMDDHWAVGFNPLLVGV
jgi:hypothetical protein